MTVLYANPYSGARGFTFESQAEFEQKMAKLRARGVEEVEVEFHDGDKAAQQLWDALAKRGLVGLGAEDGFDAYFDRVLGLNEHDQAALFWLVEHYGWDAKNGDLDEALAKVDDEVRCFEGDLEDYAHELIDDIGVENVSSPEAYFDYEQFGRDAKMDLDADSEDDAYAFDMSDQEYGEELVDNMGFDSIGKDNLSRYFDYEKFARDLDLGGDAHEFPFASKTWVCTNPNI